jgi:hypothetical protein
MMNQFILTTLLVITASSASAGVIFTTGLGSSGNNPAFDTTTGIHKDVPVEENSTGQYLILADPFSLAADSTATDLLVPLSLEGTGTFGNGPELDFYIVADESGLPDSDTAGNPVAALYSGSATGITGTTPAVYDVSLTGSATLTAGTTYWLLAKTPGTSPGTPCAPSCGLTVDEWYNNYSSTKATGYLSDFGASGWADVTNPTMAFTIEGGSAAPEPSTFLMLIGGLVAAIALSFTRISGRLSQAAAKSSLR